MAGQIGERVTVRFPRALFDAEAAKRAAYQLSDMLAAEIEIDDEQLCCRLIPLNADANIAALEAQFRNAVLDHDLRIRIGKETEPVRNLVLSLAFSRTGLQE